MKNYLKKIFIDGLSGMALGLFSTLIIGTILGQFGKLIGGEIGAYLIAISSIAKTITGAGIGVGIASKFKETPLVTVGAGVAGMIGAFPVLNPEFVLGKPGEPLGAFVAAYVGIQIGSAVSGKTKLDILLTPLVTILSGAAAGFFAGPYITKFMYFVGDLVNVNVEKSPIIGGIIIAVGMGIILTLPISSAAIGIAMGISGIAAGSAVVGCCCQMVGFAVASYRENGMGGLFAQGVGTSMLQMPNIIKKPIIWLPSIIASAILGPISSSVLKMVSTPVGSGMGTSGFVGQFATYDSMILNGFSVEMTMIMMLFMHFILPAILVFTISEAMRKAGWIKKGDMTLKL
jgi:uncharacterized membrane protein